MFHRRSPPACLVYPSCEPLQWWRLTLEFCLLEAERLQEAGGPGWKKCWCVLESGLPPAATTTFLINHTFHLSSPTTGKTRQPFLFQQIISVLTHYFLWDQMGCQVKSRLKFGPACYCLMHGFSFDQISIKLVENVVPPLSHSTTHSGFRTNYSATHSFIDFIQMQVKFREAMKQRMRVGRGRVSWEEVCSATVPYLVSAPKSCFNWHPGLPHPGPHAPNRAFSYGQVAGQCFVLQRLQQQQEGGSNESCLFIFSISSRPWGCHCCR